jgi:hypothetical protein
MNNLGSMLANGRGVSADPEEAAQWVVRALESGSSFTLKQMKENSSAWGRPFRKALQRQLKAEGLYSGSIDGKFGRSTIGAIEALAQQ